MKRTNIILSVAVAAILTFGFIYKTDVKQSGNAIGLEKGNSAPELKYMSPEGKDFWASWCGPCRMENPNVVAAYNKYKDKKFKDGKGFAIYSVSLDQNKDAWLRAIQKDQLSWPEHVSDLKGWYSEAAQKYGVNSIPTNFLLDGRGVIVGKALRGPALEEALDKLLAQ
ncbi:MAG: TlpA family protein disulfide reductase [Bacteroidetes bacterium]|nr:TlpA family protein disulfide reductase [Bacteroidota bacterium]